jgi:CHAT domain-containing protein/Tfp pilus assembly protein PilF
MKTTQFLLSIWLCLAIGLPLTVTNSIVSASVIAQANQNERQAEADKLKQAGIDLRDRGNFSAALVKFQQALAIYQELGDRVSQGRMLRRICVVTSRQGKIKTALDFCQQSLAIAKAVDDREGLGNTLNEIGSIYRKIGKYQQATEFFLQAIAIFRELKFQDSESAVLNNLAGTYESLGQYAKALETFQQALALSRVSKDRLNEGRILAGIGLIYRNRAEYDRALTFFQQSQKIAEEIDDRAGLGAALENIGQVQLKLDNYDLALTYFAKAGQIFSQIGDRIGSELNFNNQGVAYESLGKYAKALEAFNNALKIDREIGNRTQEGTTLGNIGTIYQVLGQYQLALKYYQSSLEIVQDIGDKDGEGTTLNNMGIIYHRLKQYDEAKSYHERALAIHQSIGNRSGESSSLNSLAETYYSLGQYSLALTYHNKALIIAKAIGDRSSEAGFLINIGNDYLNTGELEKSLTFYRNATEIARQIKFREFEGIALSSQGKVLDKLNRLPEAEAQLRASIDVWESLRVGLIDKDKISFSDRIRFTYNLLQKVLIKQNKSQAALEIAERGRARVLAELLASKIPTVNSATSQKIRQAPNLSKIQQIARAQKATLVEYSTIDDRILIWVIKPTGQITFHQTQLPPKTTLKDLIVATRDGIGANRSARTKDDTPNPTGGDLKQLHQLLIAPIVKDLPTKPEDRVIILPQNELFLVPFAALQDAQDKYFIQQHTLTIAPSIQVLALTETKSNRLSKTPPLVVGNPIMPLFGGTQLANLPGSEAEAKGIGTILKVAPLIGAQADKQQVIALMKTAPIIHLATHGLLDTIKGDIPGAIALTNGFLTSGEIFDMQLSANLVVLSACDTGRGDLTGEGVVGLSRSLSVAGVPSVIVSLWEVNDEATKALMEEFYRNLQLKKLPKAQALRQAMLTTMVDYPNPNFWSAFMLVGEGR